MESGWLAERVAKRLQVKVERVNAWEQGERQPTLRQVEALSRFLHRPLSVFFLPKPPELPPLAVEYRRLPGIRAGHESPELRLAVRQMLTRRENALNLMVEMGTSIPEFELVAHLSELILIHPFRDGNGRLARLLALLMELQAGLPPLDFSPLDGRGKQRYIAGIHAAMGRDYRTLTEMFGKVISRTWKRVSSSSRGGPVQSETARCGGS